MALFVKPSRIVLGVLCLTTATASISLWAADTASEPMAPQTTVTTLTKPGFFTEPGIAINQLDPRNVTAIYQDNVHIAFSNDAGAKWSDVPKVAPPEWRVSGDVSVTYDNNGHAIASFMAFNRLGTEGYWAHNAPAGGLYIRRSLDGGKTWESQARAVIEHVGDHPPPLWEDKPYIVADQSRGPHAGNLYIGWTRWTLTGSEILLSRSTDDGLSWSTPMEIDDHPGLPRDDTGANEGFWGVVGADSTFYAVWADTSHIAFTLSKDGGRTFSKARDVISTAPIMYGIADLDRANGFPQLAIDPRATPDAPHGRLYVTWADYRNGGVDVFLSTSVDEGNNWTPAIRVNDDPMHNGADHFFPALAVDPINGDVYVSFYDRRADPHERAVTVTLARSTDHGNTFVNYAWTKQPFIMRNVFMGDYSGLAARDGHVYGIWTEHVETPRTSGKPEARDPHHDNNTVVNVGTAIFH
ncbi:sialidase family protein [Dyella sp. 2HG41-7]|uniref:sialidase family protein n=1 Tax=Dyella sp. 2HG41-7 TaxID=2883239 RepID=UPI001F3F483F|nr:sialidase family protein [Dyella sp. 2HG41-7]